MSLSIVFEAPAPCFSFPRVSRLKVLFTCLTFRCVDKGESSWHLLVSVYAVQNDRIHRKSPWRRRPAKLIQCKRRPLRSRVCKCLSSRHRPWAFSDRLTFVCLKCVNLLLTEHRLLSALEPSIDLYLYMIGSALIQSNRWERKPLTYSDVLQTTFLSHARCAV